MLIGKSKLIKFKSGKKIGILCSDMTFRMFKNEKRHTFRLYSGFGLNRELYNELKSIGVKFIEINCSDTKKIYKVPLFHFEQYGIAYRNPKKEKDYQFILPKKFFAVRSTLPEKPINDFFKEV